MRYSVSSVQAFSRVGLTGLTSRFIGSGFVGWTYCGFSDWGDLVSISRVTGATTFLDNYDSDTTALNRGPQFTGLFGVTAEPAAMWQSGMALICLSM